MKKTKKTRRTNRNAPAAREAVFEPCCQAPTPSKFAPGDVVALAGFSQPMTVTQGSQARYVQCVWIDDGKPCSICVDEDALVLLQARNPPGSAPTGGTDRLPEHES